MKTVFQYKGAAVKLIEQSPRRYSVSIEGLITFEFNGTATGAQLAAYQAIDIAEGE